MRFFAILFEVTNQIPSVGYMYLSGIFLAALVFSATYFHNQVGLITLLIVGLLCSQDLESTGVINSAINQAGQENVAHWNYSSRITFILSVILFFTAIMIKRRRKQKNKID